MFVIEGHVIEEINRGSVQHGASFLIEKKCEELKDLAMITIGNTNVLPSYCPWIQYRIGVSFPITGSVYKIEKVINCSPRKVELINQKTKEFYCIKSLKDAKEEPQRIQIGLRPRFSSPVFFALLPYFSSEYLLKFDNEQLYMFYMVLKLRPYLFCFWDVLKRVLYNLEGSPFSKEKRELDIQNYFIVEDGYSRTCPIWSFKRLEESKIKIRYPIPIVEGAIKLYSKIQEKHFLFGDDRLLIEKNQKEDVMNFLKKENILIPSMNENYLVLPETEVDELQVIKLIIKKKIKFILNDWNFYGKDYTDAIAIWYVQLKEKQELLLLSANQPSACYIQKKTGIETHSIDKFLNLDDKLKKKKIIGIDRFHKTSLKDLRNILKCCKEEAMIIVFYDSEDFVCNTRRGTGDIAIQLSKIPGVCVNHRTDCDEENPLYKTYNSFHNPEGIILGDVFAVPLSKAKDISDFVRRMKNEIKSNKDKEECIADYQIFYSHESDKYLAKEISKPLKDETKDLFYIGQKVWVLQNDDIGTIKKISKREKNGKFAKINLDAKSAVDFKSNSVFNVEIFSIGGVLTSYSTDKYTFLHTKAINITKYAGPPVRHALFIAGKLTNRKHIYNATKYAEHELKIFLAKDVILTNMTKGNTYRPDSGFGDKLKKFLV